MYHGLLKFIKLYFFNKKWRKINKQNYTTAGTIFPINKVSVGEMSYGYLNVFSWDYPIEQLTIGNYVSIASGVKFLLSGEHYYNTFSTYSFKVMLMGKERETYSKGPIIVDDDVWIGMDAMILSGVKIGRGAIVGARAVVAKDIPPYAIVVGNPAKIVKYRFSDEIIKLVDDIEFKGIKDKINNKNINLFYKKLDQKVIEEINNFLRNL